MDKAYSRITWENDPSRATPLNATNLNRMDSSLDIIDNRVATHDDSILYLQIAQQGAEAELETVTQELTTRLDSIDATLSEKVDGGYVSNGYLVLTADGEPVGDPLGPFAGEGGGGGGGSTVATMTVTNATGWLQTTVSADTDVYLSLIWSSVLDDIPTGVGTAQITVSGAVKYTATVEQGQVTVNVKDYLVNGANRIKFKITDEYGSSRTINFTVTLVELILTSSFSPTTPFAGSFLFPYIIVGIAEKTVFFKVDGVQIATATVATSGRQVTQTIPAQTHGGHTLEVYATAVIAGSEVESNHLFYGFASIESGNDTPIIFSPYNTDTIGQYGTVAIPYSVYDPSNYNASVTLSVSDDDFATTIYSSTITVDRTQQIWSYRVLEQGSFTFRIACGTEHLDFDITVSESQMDIGAETEDLALYLNAAGRSNGEADPSVWTYTDNRDPENPVTIAATLTGFNYVSNGWVLDDDNNTVLRINNGASVTIPYQIFATDFRGSGKTIEIDFATRDVLNYDTEIMSCWSGGRGINVTAQTAEFKSEQSQVDVQYKEDEHMRLSFVVEKSNSSDRLILVYIDGIMSRAVQYPTLDNFAQATPVGITLGSNDATLDIYCIRVYDNDLTRFQIVKNWISDTQNIDDMIARYTRNDIFDEYGQIVINKLPSDLPYFTFVAAEMPTYKGDKKTVSGDFIDPSGTFESFEFSGAQADVQGTSSQAYPRKNFKVKFKGGFDIDGENVDDYAMRGNSSIPTSTFTFKADFASSEGANNVELVRLYNDLCPYKTPHQEEDPRIRQGIDGFPMVVFQNNGTSVDFIGKYNFNNDKGTEEVYGFSDGDESWEILNNTSERVIWKSADYSGNGWLQDFEARFPDTDPAYTNNAQLAEFAAWVVSTDPEQATNAALPESVTYGGVTYTTDSEAYRLAKFDAEVEDYVEIDSAYFYYLFTELFLMVDSRAKNAFPSFMGSEVV